MEVSSRLSSLESQISSLRHERSRLLADLEVERTKFELAEEAKTKFVATFTAVLLFLFHISTYLDLESRGRLHSASSSSLIVRRTRLSPVDDRASPVAAVPRSLSWGPSMSRTNCHATSRLHRPHRVFDSRLKTPPFSCSFPDFLCSACEVTCVVIAFVTYLL